MFAVPVHRGCGVRPAQPAQSPGAAAFPTFSIVTSCLLSTLQPCTASRQKAAHVVQRQLRQLPALPEPASAPDPPHLAAQVTPDLETPQYSVLRKAPEYEIRRYEGYMVAETSMPANTGPAGGTGFQELASYIFSGNSRCGFYYVPSWRSLRRTQGNCMCVLLRCSCLQIDWCTCSLRAVSAVLLAAISQVYKLTSFAHAWFMQGGKHGDDHPGHQHSRAAGAGAQNAVCHGAEVRREGRALAPA